MKKIVYADNAATTPLDIDAFEEMKPYLLSEFGNPSQPYSFSKVPKNALKESRKIIAESIGASPEEIYFTSGGTESDNWAIKSSILCQKKNKRIITSAFEHHAILNACSSMQRFETMIDYIYPDEFGYILPESLGKIISDNTSITSIMYANNEIGTIQPIKQCCDIAHQHGSIFHTDAVQAVGHIDIDVKKLGVDMMSASAHKFNGPRGIGFLYIRNGVDLAPYIDGGSQEKCKRAGTENVASIVAMAVALQKNCKHLQENMSYISQLEKQLIKELNNYKLNFIINGGEDKLPGLLSLSFPGLDGESIFHSMDLLGVCISTGSACNGNNTEVSHVLKSIKLEDFVAKGTIRISLGKNNTFEDVSIIARSLNKIISENNLV